VEQRLEPGRCCHYRAGDRALAGADSGVAGGAEVALAESARAEGAGGAGAEGARAEGAGGKGARGAGARGAGARCAGAEGARGAEARGAGARGAGAEGAGAEDGELLSPGRGGGGAVQGLRAGRPLGPRHSRLQFCLRSD
jgi:hypothetical protein